MQEDRHDKCVRITGLWEMTDLQSSFKAVDESTGEELIIYTAGYSRNCTNIGDVLEPDEFTLTPINFNDYSPLNLPPGVEYYANKKGIVRVEPPMICPYCRSGVKVVHHNEVYNKSYGDWPWLYKCSNSKCDTHVGIHKYTDIPLGRLANKHLRNLRKFVKNIFVNSWMYKKNIDIAYKKLAKDLALSSEATHFGNFNTVQCHNALDAMCKW